MHKCDTCMYKGEHQEMGFRSFGVCLKEQDLLKAVLAYRAPECPFAQKKTPGLKPCPFCGKAVHIIYNSSENAFMIYHKDAYYEETCKIIEPIRLKGLSLADAAEAWNRRATDGE